MPVFFWPVELIFFCCEDLIHFGKVFFKSREQGLHFPGENACVPKKISAGNEGLGQFGIWLLCEGLYLMYFRSRHQCIVLNITITGVGCGGLDTNGDQRIDMFYETERFFAVLMNSLVSRIRLSAGAAIITASGSF